jgi:hypothetical protein
MAFYPNCGSYNSEGASIANCDITQFLQQEYGALPDSGFSTVIGTITGAFIGGVAGSFVPILGTVKGAVLLGGVALEQELHNDYSYMSSFYVTQSVQSAVNIIYNDFYNTGYFTNFENESYISCFSPYANLCDDIPQIEGTAAWATFYYSLSANIIIRSFFLGDLKSSVGDLIKWGATTSNKTRCS